MTYSHSFKSSTAGFTLIEILVALVIVSVALLSLGSFAISIIDNGQQSRERLSAVHLAEQVLEFWQHDSNDYVPTLATDCALTAATAAPSYPVTSICTPGTGVAMSYTVVASNTKASGPLPKDLSNFKSFKSKGWSVTPMTKVVTVSWSHKGKALSIYLTHLTAVQ